MAERNLEYLLGFKTQDAKKAQQDIKGVAKASKELEASQEASASTAKKVNQELAKINKRRSDLERISQAYKNTALNADDMGVATAKAANLLLRMGATQGEIRGVVRQLGDGTQEAQALAIALDKAEKNAHELADIRFRDVSQRVALAGDVQSNLGAVRGLASTAGLGGAGAGIGAAGELIVLAEELPRLKTALQGMPQVVKAAAGEIGLGGAGLIGGLVALTAVTALARKEFQDSAKAFRAQIDAQKSAFELIRTGSAEDIQTRRNSLEQQLKLQQDYLSAIEADYQKRIQGAQSELGAPVVDIIEFTSNNLGIGAGAISEYNKQIEDQRNVVSGLQTEFNALNQAIDNNAISAEIATQRERELAEERRGQRTSEAIALVNEIANAQVEANRLIKEGNQEALDDKVNTLYEEIRQAELVNNQLKELYVNSSGLQRDAIYEEIRANEARIFQIKDNLIPVYDQATDSISDNANAMRDFAGEIIKGAGATRSLKDMVDDIQASTTETVKLNQDLATIAQKGADKIADIRRNLSTKEADLLSQLSQSLADARTKANQAIEDANQKHTDSLLDLERDYAEERAKIVKDASKEINRAIGDRDVLAWQQARASRNDQLDDARTNFDKQRRELQISYERQLRDISINLQRQENELRTRYNRQLEAARQAAQASIQLENQRIQAELRLKQQGHQAMLQAEQSFVQTQIAMMQNLATSAAGIFGNLAGAVANAQNVATSGTAGALNILNQGGYNTPVNVSGGNTNTANINQTNNFPSGANSQQIVDQIIGQIANLF